jgi:MHS family proline/betaine transporter-like MFS transporter
VASPAIPDPSSPAPAAPTSPAARQSTVRTALAGLIGNVLEWFDFGVYGFFSSDIAAQFFPGDSLLAQRLKGLLVFAIGFVARPVGGLVLGRIGDRIGRRALLTLSIAMMGCATLALGLLPGYASIGVAAPVLLVVLRMIQGFSLGGEFTGSMVYTTELASPTWRGLLSSSTAAGTTLGFLLGSATAWVVSVILGKAETSVWGWRIPFIASIALVIAGLALRRGIRETDQGEQVAGKRPPIWKSLVADWRPFVQTFGIVAMTNATYYLAFTFAIDRRKSEPGADSSAFLAANTLSLVVVLLAKPFGGWLSDKIGRRRLMIALNVIDIAIIYSATQLMMNGTRNEFMLGQMMIGVVAGTALGLQGAMCVEIFPLRTRVMSMSFAYSLTLVLSGGIAPFISTWLVEGKHMPLAPAYYMIGYGVIGLAIMLGMRETNQRSLTE